MSRSRKKKTVATEPEVRKSKSVNWKEQTVWLCLKCRTKKYEGVIGEAVLCDACQQPMWRHTWLKEVSRNDDVEKPSAVESGDTSDGGEPVSVESSEPERDSVPELRE